MPLDHLSLTSIFIAVAVVDIGETPNTFVMLERTVIFATVGCCYCSAVPCFVVAVAYSLLFVVLLLCEIYSGCSVLFL